MTKNYGQLVLTIKLTSCDVVLMIISLSFIRMIIYWMAVL